MSLKPLSRVFSWAFLGMFAVGMGGVFLAPATLRSASFIFGLSSLIIGLLFSLSVGFRGVSRTYAAPQWKVTLAIVNGALVVVIALTLWRSFTEEARSGHLDFMFILESFLAAASLLLLRGVGKKKLAKAMLAPGPNQSPDRTPTSGTPRAGHEPRLP